MARPLARNFSLRLALILGLGFLLPGLALATGTLTITCLDIGQGDATLIESPSGQTLLFDGGPNGRGNSVIVPFLQANGIDYLDYTVASHYHADHVGGLDEVAAQIDIGVAYDRGWSYTTATYTSYANAVSDVRQTLMPGQVIDLGEGVTVTCLALNSNGQLSSPYTNSSYENEYDVCLLIQYGGFDYFQAGDLTGEPDSGYRDIETSVAPLAGDIDVYHVSHHGSASSSTAFFLQTVQAEVSVISLGNNSYGHPNQGVLDRLVQYGSFVYQTEVGSGGTLPANDLKVVNGHVVIQTDGVTNYSVDGDNWLIDESPVTPASPAPALALQLLGNYPNPFNPRTEIRFACADAGPVQLGIYDLTGKRVYEEKIQASAGINSFPWMGVHADGRPAAGGTYLYRVSSAAGNLSGRMMLIK